MIRNTPYGKRIQSKLQREHMEHHHGYGNPAGNGYNQQAALLNLALGTGNMGGMGGMASPGPNPNHAHSHRHLGNPSLHHVNALSDAYGSRSLGGYSHQTIDHFGNPSAGSGSNPAQFTNLAGPGAFGGGAGLGDYAHQAGFPYM